MSIRKSMRYIDAQCILIFTMSINKHLDCRKRMCDEHEECRTIVDMNDSFSPIYESGHACDNELKATVHDNGNDNNDNTCARSGVSVLSAVW